MVKLPVDARVLILFLVLLLAAPAGCNSRGGGESDSGAEADSLGLAGEDSTDAGDDRDDDAEEKGDGEDGEESEEEAVLVGVTVLGLGPIESVIRASANLEAESQVQVVAESARRVRELLVEEGDRVKKGQLLLRLQGDEQRSNLEKARARFEKAEREHLRQQNLFEQDLTSEQRLNDAAHEYRQQKIAVADAQRELDYTEVRAAISGTVTSRLVNLGDQVQIGQHLFDIIDFASIVARVYIPEKHIGQLRPGLEARITAQVTSKSAFSAEVSRIAPVVDPRSGTVKVTVAIGKQPGLLPGMYVDVDLITDVHPDAVLIPKRALVYDSDQIFVYRLTDESRVERIKIIPILSNSEFVEPLEGMASGDTVVVAGQAGLKDGALIVLPDTDREDEEDAEDGDTPSDLETAQASTATGR